MGHTCGNSKTKMRDPLQDLHKALPFITKIKGLPGNYKWRPGMDQEIEDMVQTCDVCQESCVMPALALFYPWKRPDEL